MNTKRCTPQGAHKPPLSASKFKTPPHLNLTVREQANTATRSFKSGSKYLKSASHLDLTSLGSSHPNIRKNLTNISAFHVDYEGECDLVYSDYLQSHMKQQINKRSIQKHEEETVHQLAIQKDYLFKAKMKYRNSEAELVNLEMLKEVEQVVNSLNSNVDLFSELNENFNLQDSLEQLLRLLNHCCNSVNVRNVKIIEQKEEFEKLKTTINQCLVASQKMGLEHRNPAEIHSLGSVMKKYQENVQLVNHKHKYLQKSQKNELLKLFKTISDMYAEREKY